MIKKNIQLEIFFPFLIFETFSPARENGDSQKKSNNGRF
jgi:hypothetical protein